MFLPASLRFHSSGFQFPPARGICFLFGAGLLTPSKRPTEGLQQLRLSVINRQSQFSLRIRAEWVLRISLIIVSETKDETSADRR